MAPSQLQHGPKPWPLFLIVGLALLANGVWWAVRFPPMHPADEPQHYLYATRYDGTPAEDGREPDEVARDIQAFAELVQFGPHRHERFAIDFSEKRADELERLAKEADDPGKAAVFVPDSKKNKIIGHPDFENYHPPFYYAVTGQVLKLGHALGLGVRGRLLLGRLWSVVLSLIAAWFAVLLARWLWPDNWGMALLVGLATGWQALVAFYSSAVTNEAMTYLLFTVFLAIAAGFIGRRPGWGRTAALVGVGALALLTKITMVALVPIALIATAMSTGRRWLRVSALAVVSLFFVVSIAWLTIPLSGGESMVATYAAEDVEPRSFPPEMFRPRRIMIHVKLVLQNWGRQIGNDVYTDARVPGLMFDGMVLLSLLAMLSVLLRLRRTEPQPRRLLLWLFLAPLMVLGFFYAVDYRFASIGGSKFVPRAQYYIPTASAQMTLIVWGLTGWFKGRARAWIAGGFLAIVLAYNLYALVGVVGPRYYGSVGWWGQCERISMLWPVPAWSVAALDLLMVLTGVAAVVLVAVGVQRPWAPKGPNSALKD